MSGTGLQNTIRVHNDKNVKKRKKKATTKTTTRTKTNEYPKKAQEAGLSGALPACLSNYKLPQG